MRAARPFKALSLNLLIALAAAGVAVPSVHAATTPKTMLVAELAEDENVEDIEHSEPRQAKPAQPASAAPEQALPTVSPIADPADTAPDTARQGDGVGGGAGGGIDGGVQDGTATGEAVEQPAATADAPIEPAPATALQLLGAEVPPGTSTRLAWSPAIQIAGLSQPTPVLVINGANPGPTLCLTGAVHGDELNGIEIIRRTVYDVVPEKLAGRVVGIPIVNLPGFQQGTRYLPDRRDLNRHFPGSADGSLADRIAHSLFESVIRHCDMLVDIHTCHSCGQT